jgi:hypothetical protein
MQARLQPFAGAVFRNASCIGRAHAMVAQQFCYNLFGGKTVTTPNIHALSNGHVPGYITGPDGSDPLFTGMAIFTIVLIIAIGGLYFTLHALPEKMAHSDNHAQFQLISILAVLALFTHNNIFWVAALMLAAFRMPDFLSPLQSIANSLVELSQRKNKE